MEKLLVVFVAALQLLAPDASASKLGFVPQVAFICNKPAMHMTKSGSWEADTKTGCLNQPKEILDYCKKLYPGLDITNVMESPEPSTIPKWCKDGKTDCKHSQHVVYPYRCVVGQFESEPLLVPEHCQFDHVHDASKCLAETTWHGRAFEECGKKRMLVQSSSMLMPCGTELFAGVEFVCCPKSKVVDAAPTEKAADPMKGFGSSFDDDDDYDYEEEEDEDADSLLSDIRAGNVGPVVMSGLSTTEKPKKSSTVAPAFNTNFDSEDDDEDDYEDDEDYFEDYDEPKEQPKAAKESKKPVLGKDDLPLWRLYLAGDLAGTEHEYDKEQQLFEEVMVSWRADFDQRDKQLKKDWEEAKQNVKQTKGDQSALNTVSDEFRRSFNTLKDQGDSEHVRLLDVHDQRIESRLVQRQKQATKKLTEVIQTSPADAEEVADYLEDLIDIEEKQKKHAVNYFSKLRSIQLAASDKVLPDLKTRIRRVEDQLSQSMDLLKKLPERDMNKIKPEITAYLKTYQDVEDAASLMMRLVPQQKVNPSQLQMDSSEEFDDDDDYDEPLGLMDDEAEDDSEEDGAGIDLEYNSKIKAEMQAIKDEQQVFERLPGNASLSTLMIVGTAIAAAMLLLLAVGLVVYRSVSRQKYAGRMLVTTAISPEERHVNNMQSSGYENPTYKYFYEVNA